MRMSYADHDERVYGVRMNTCEGDDPKPKPKPTKKAVQISAETVRMIDMFRAEYSVTLSRNVAADFLIRAGLMQHGISADDLPKSPDQSTRE